MPDRIRVIPQHQLFLRIDPIQAVDLQHDVALSQHAQAGDDGVVEVLAGDVDVGSDGVELGDFAVDEGFQVELGEAAVAVLQEGGGDEGDGDDGDDFSHGFHEVAA